MANADAESNAEGLNNVDGPSTTSSTFSLSTNEANTPLPVPMPTSALPGGKNNEKNPSPVAFEADTASGDDPCASFARELRQRDDAGSRGKDVWHWVHKDGRPVHPAPAATSTRNAEDGSSTRAPTSASAASFAWLYQEGLKSDLEVCGAGGWADFEARRTSALDFSDSD
jgi:hypothetical protein